MTGKYPRDTQYEAYSPKVANDTFNNTDTALVVTEIVPANPSSDELPWLNPQRNDEEKRAVGDGMGVGEVYDLGFEDGAGSKRSTCIFGLHIKDSFKKLVFGDLARVTAEITTVTCIASDGSNLDGKYFNFEVVDADSPYILKKYTCWIDINNGSDDPTPADRTGVSAEIAAGIVTDSAVATAVVNAIDAIDDAGAAAGAGESDHIVTITNATAGAVDDAHDIDTGFTIAVTQDGVTTKTITESGTLPNVGFHDEKEESGLEIREDFVGVTQLEYTWECEEGGKIEEERNYLVAKNLAGSDLARPRGPDGTAWGVTHPYSKYKNNFNWGDITFTFVYGDGVGCTITSISIVVILEVDYKRNDGDEYSNERYVKVRDYIITMTVRPTNKDLYTIQKLHYKSYTNDLTLTVKAKRGDDAADYIEWVFTKLRLLPIEYMVPAAEQYWDEYDIEMHAAPGNTTTVNISDHLSQRHYGVD